MRISDGSSYVCSSDLVLFGEPLRGALGEITQDHVGASAAEAQQRFEHRLAFIEPAVADRALQHRILAADLVRGGWQAELILHAEDDVEIRQDRKSTRLNFSH